MEQVPDEEEEEEEGAEGEESTCASDTFLVRLLFSVL